MNKKSRKPEKPFLKAPDILSAFHLEADKCGLGLAIVIGGVKSVLEINESMAKLNCSVGSVLVRGSGIDVEIYENKTVEITGKVEALEFGYAKN